MKFRNPTLACGGLMFLLLQPTAALAQEQTVPCNTVPQAVRAAFARAYPKATIRACAKETNFGEHVAHEVHITYPIDSLAPRECVGVRLVSNHRAFA